MRKQIKELEELLYKEGFNQCDYIISLQGPTVIFCETGKKKINISVENKIKSLKALII